VESFKKLKGSLLEDPSFRALYEQECHICRHTMRIFACLTKQGRGCEDLARALGVNRAALEKLAAAEQCDPHLTLRLCRHLALPLPEDCPRLASG